MIKPPRRSSFKSARETVTCKSTSAPSRSQPRPLRKNKSSKGGAMRQLFRRRHALLIVAILVAAAMACARQPDPSRQLPATDLAFWGQVGGFLVGVFHGSMIGVNM